MRLSLWLFFHISFLVFVLPEKLVSTRVENKAHWKLGTMQLRFRDMTLKRSIPPPPPRNMKLAHPLLTPKSATFPHSNFFSLQKPFNFISTHQIFSQSFETLFRVKSLIYGTEGIEPSCVFPVCPFLGMLQFDEKNLARRQISNGRSCQPLPSLSWSIIKRVLPPPLPPSPSPPSSSFSSSISFSYITCTGERMTSQVEGLTRFDLRRRSAVQLLLLVACLLQGEFFLFCVLKGRVSRNRAQRSNIA